MFPTFKYKQHTIQEKQLSTVHVFRWRKNWQRRLRRAAFGFGWGGRTSAWERTPNPRQQPQGMTGRRPGDVPGLKERNAGAWWFPDDDPAADPWAPEEVWQAAMPIRWFHLPVHLLSLNQKWHIGMLILQRSAAVRRVYCRYPTSRNQRKCKSH